MKAAYDRLGADIELGSASEFAKFVAGEGKKWPPLIKTLGLKPE